MNSVQSVFSAVIGWSGSRMPAMSADWSTRSLRCQRLTPELPIFLSRLATLKRARSCAKIVEAAKTALAIPCYADDSRGVQALIDEELGGAGLTIQGEARQRLSQLLGGDRLQAVANSENLHFIVTVPVRSPTRMLSKRSVMWPHCRWMMPSRRCSPGDAARLEAA
jgi:hypothetical protein